MYEVHTHTHTYIYLLKNPDWYTTTTGIQEEKKNCWFLFLKGSGTTSQQTYTIYCQYIQYLGG